MKKVTLLAVISILGTIILISVFQKKKSIPAPVDTIIVDGEDDEHFQRKQEWFDAMHRCAPEANWRKMDIASRQQRMLSIDKTKAIQGEWREVGSNNLAGRTHLADYDSVTGEVYLVSSGGNIWKGMPGNNDWECLNENYQITGMHFFRRIPFNGGERWLAATGDWNIQGFLYSDDLGASWNYTTGLENAENWGTLRRACIVNDVIYALTMEWDYSNWNKITCVYKSVDMGESFEQILEFPEPEYGAESEFDMWAGYYYPENIYLIAGTTFGKLDAQGQFTVLGNLPQTSGQTRLSAFDENNPQNFYIAKTSNNVTQFFASSDGGNTWSQKGSVSEGPFQMNSFAVSVDNANTLYFGGVSCFRSLNGGQTWTKKNEWWQYYGSEETMLHADIPGISPFKVDGQELLFINTDGGTYISTDYLSSVQNISMENLRVSQYYSTYTYKNDPDVIYAGAQDQGFQRTVAGQSGEDVYAFDQLISGDYGHIVSGDNGASIWTVYPTFAMYYPNAVTGEENMMWSFTGSGYYWMPQLMEDPYNPTSCYVAGGSTTSGSHIFYLSANGSSISYVEQAFDFSEGGDAKISAMAYDKSNPINRYVLTSEGTFFISNDFGSTWRKSEGFSGPGCHFFYGASIIVSQNNPNTIYIGGSGYSSSPVFVSYDAGESFEPYNDGLPFTLVFDLVLNDDETMLFAATEIGAFACDLETGEWTDLFDAGVPDQAFWSVEWVDDFARFATYGRGIWDFTPTTNVGIDTYNNQISVYPNPADEYIKYELPANAANIALVSLNGSVLNTIEKNTGIIDVSNNDNGVVFLTCFVDGQKISKKIIIAH